MSNKALSSLPSLLPNIRSNLGRGRHHFIVAPCTTNIRLTTPPLLRATNSIHPPRSSSPQFKHQFTTLAPKMSFTNANTGSKDADPYTSKNSENPSIERKVEDLVEFVSNEKFGMMTTRDGKSGALVSRCMAIAGKENGGIDLLFHTNTESGKTDDIDSDSHINISFYNGTGEWASISGRASIITDRELVKKHYSPALKAWLGDLGDGKHDGGPEDPRIGIIRVETVTATYALARGTKAGGFVELAKGVVTGSAPKVNKLREVTQQDVATWRQSKQLVQ